MEAPAKTHQNKKKRKFGEVSTEDRGDLGSTSDDRQGIQEDFFSCLVCVMKTQRDSSDNRSEEYCEVIPQHLSRSLLELTDCTSSHNLSARAYCDLMLDALVHILKQGNDERSVTYHRVNFRCEPHERQGMVSFKEVDPLELHLSPIGEEGGRMNFKILVKIMKEPGGIFFTLGSFEHHARASSQPSSLNLKHFYFKDIWYSNGLAVPPPRPYILDSPAEEAQHFTRVSSDIKEEERDWSSLAVLPLLMIRDRLNVFDNRRLAAVCRDWRSTSARYPKNLYSFGDRVPWICHVKYGRESHSREFISARNRNFQVDMPEFAHSTVLFSKGGWILLHQNGGGVWGAEFPSSWFLVNPFTRDRIELPKIEGDNMRCYGSFTLRDADGYPDRVILIIPELPFQASIHTTRPGGGDKVWTSHNYVGLEITFLENFTHVVIGDNVYCLHWSRHITNINVANNSVKVLPRLPYSGFITEHRGRLIHVNVANKCKSFVVVDRFNGASSSWERLSRNAVMGTSWYLCDEGPHNKVVAGKGRGLKVYKLNKKIEWSGRRRTGIHYDVYVRDLLTGKARTLRFPYPDHKRLLWVAIG